MSAKIKYTDEPIGNPRVVADFLPLPEDLVFQDEGVKVTIALSKRSVDFFKDFELKKQISFFRSPAVASLAKALKSWQPAL